MFDITQVRSGLNTKNLKTDLIYIDDTLNDVIYTEEFTADEITLNLPDYKYELAELKKMAHIHDNMPVLNKITNEMVDLWDATSPTKLSQLINDAEYVDKDYVDSKIKELTGGSSDDFTLVSPNKNEYLVTVGESGALITIKLDISNDTPINRNVILKSPNDGSFLLTVDNDGVLRTSEIK